MKVFQKFGQFFWENWVALLLSLFMLSCLPILTDWLGNRYQVTLEDLYLPLMLSLLTSVVLTLIFAKSFRQNKLATMLGSIFALLVINQGYDSRLNTFLPILRAVAPLSDQKEREGVVYSLVFLLLIIGLAFAIIYLVKHITSAKKWQLDPFARALTIVIAVAFLLQVYPTVNTIIKEWTQFSYRPPVLAASATRTQNKPDVYYLVLDRYTNQNVLKTQFDFDNADFINYLNANGFSVDPNAHSNYPYTAMSIASTLNANYDGDMVKKFAGSSTQILQPYEDSIRYSSVIQKFKSLGYTYDQLGTWFEASNQAPLADHNYQPEGQLTVLGQTGILNNFSKNKLTQSAYWQFVKYGISFGNHKLISYSSISETGATNYKLKQLKSITSQPAGGKLVFAHLLVPHDPYYFNADGSLSTTPGTDNTGEPIKNKYLGQVQFINSQMKTLVDEIKKNSNNQAVIIIQADEGPYPSQLNAQNFDSVAVGDELDNGDMTKWSDADLQMKYGVLAAYDIPAVNKADLAAGGNSVNIFRLALNSYFNTNLPYLPECSYALSEGREQSFVYKDITARLTGTSNPACPADSKF